MADGHERGFSGQRLADLMEEPRVADGTAADHQTGGAGICQDFGGFGGGIDVAIGEYGAG